MKYDNDYLEQFAMICSRLAVGKKNLADDFIGEVEAELQSLPDDEQEAIRKAVKHFLLVNNHQTLSLTH